MNNEGRDISEDLSRPSLFIKNDNYFIDIFCEVPVAWSTII